MRRAQLAIVAIFGVCIAQWGTRAVSADTIYFKWDFRPYGNPCQVVDKSHSIPCCTVDGWDWSGNDEAHPACPVMIDVWKRAYSCQTDAALSSADRDECPNECGCGAGNPYCGGMYPTDQSVVAPNYRCEFNNSGGQPEVCDGRTATGGTADPGCGLDECDCNADDQDPAPVRYSSGRVESNPITLFSAPDVVNELSFRYRIKYNSHVIRAAAKRNSDARPTIHHSQEDTHYIGFGWLDNFSDRLYITAVNTPATTITWMNMDRTVTFTSVNGQWKSWTGRYELIDRGTNDALGRWVVRTTDPSKPREIWSFEEFTYKPYDQSVDQRLGRLRRHAVLTSDLSNLNGRYGYTVNWTSNGTISNAIDTLGRSLEFEYHEETECVLPGDDPATCAKRTISTRLDTIRYRAGASAPPVVVGTLQTTPFPDNARLERVSGYVASNYTRFLYRLTPPAEECVHCNALLSDVIIPGDSSATSPTISAEPQPSEIVTEHDEYAPHPYNPNSMVAVRSRAPGREYAYEYSYTDTTQFDLHIDGGPCASGNTCTQAGYACHTVGEATPHCYAANVMTHDPTTLLGTQRASVGASSTSGNAEAFSRRYTSTGLPTDYVDANNIRTSYGFDSLTRPRCIVRNDDDRIAFADPSHPDTSACAGPSTAQIVRIDYTATTTTTTTPSLLSGNVTTVETIDPGSLLRTSLTLTGMTRDIDGTLHSESRTTTTNYDALGRITLTNGPLDDSVAYDATSTTYYTSYDPAWPYNLGQLASTTMYVGTAAANVAMTTTYSEYDLFGVAHRIQLADGRAKQLTISADRRTWIANDVANDGTVVATTTKVFNPDGTLRSITDDGGLCITYDYSDATGYVGVPTMIRRSTTACGGLPIDPNSDEVEIRTYLNGEAERLSAIERRNNGVVEFTYAGFTYDRDRRLVATTTANSPLPYTYQYNGIMPFGTTEPGAPAPGAGKFELAADAFARPASKAFYIDASNKQTYTYSYPSTAAVRPTQISRGINGNTAVQTTMMYDDFGQLVDITVPEVGVPTRYSYDLAGRLLLARQGVGTPDVNTTRYTYDSVDRVLSVDHDLEHPVDCSATTTPAGTPIQDEEYTYDGCATADTPTGFTCANSTARITMARVAVQCGAAQDVIKRGRWYAYDRAGRISQVAYASQSGITMAPPAISSYIYDAQGRLASVTSPLNTAFGTSYTYNSKYRVDSVGTSSTTPAPIASDLRYQASGALLGYRTASVQTTSSGSRTLDIEQTLRIDDTLIDQLARFTGTGATPSIDVLNQTLTYTAGDNLSERIDTAEPTNSRYYAYDTLQRLVCEVRDGTGADCSISSSKLAGLYAYNNGQSSTSPPDTRSTVFIHQDQYQSMATETYAYDTFGGRVTSAQSQGSSLKFEHDGLGRRTSEYLYDAATPPDSVAAARRLYNYLPNGQLGNISGRNAAGDPYSVSIRYDENNQPITITYAPGDQYELFWDAAGQLSAVNITGSTIVRWHYHYLYGALIAATRELPGISEVKRFWIVADERSLISRLVDESGATYWQAHWDATGWRTLVGTSQPNMWVPFGLPGQIILEGTDAHASSALAVRPAIALNQMRAYDPLTGAFLQPDPIDQTGRLNPEGYLYGRAEYVATFDTTGRKSISAKDVPRYRDKIPVQFRAKFLEGCTDHPIKKLLNDNRLIAKIMTEIDNCKGGKCNPDSGSFESGVSPEARGSIAQLIKNEWKLALLTGQYTCFTPKTSSIKWRENTITLQPDGRIKSPNFSDPAAAITGQVKHYDASGNEEDVIDHFERMTIVGLTPNGCWEKTFAHEAWHSMTYWLLNRQVGISTNPDWNWNTSYSTATVHPAMEPYMECIKCSR